LAGLASNERSKAVRHGQKAFIIRQGTIYDMETKELIQKEIELFPEQYLEEILDFIYTLKAKGQKNIIEAAILSESVLKQDWLSPEEDEVWKNL